MDIIGQILKFLEQRVYYNIIYKKNHIIWKKIYYTKKYIIYYTRQREYII